MKITKWHAHVVNMAKQMNMVGGPLFSRVTESLFGGGPGPLAPHKAVAALST